MRSISSLAHFKRLNTLQLAHNRLQDPADVEELAACRYIYTYENKYACTPTDTYLKHDPPC